MNRDELPKTLGFRMPAEWEPHDATWLAWPHNREDWPGKFAPIPWVYAEIIRHLARSEPVKLIVPSKKVERSARKILEQADANGEQIEFIRWKTDRVWMRDTGPSFVTRASDQSAIGLVDWRFNAWAKYENHRKDDRIPRLMAEMIGMPRWKPRAELSEGRPRVVLEGGAIDVNGVGSILTTEECLLSPIQARNPSLDRSGIERAFADYLGAPHTIWLGRGIVGDDTHGHVDDIARFVGPRKIVAVVEDDPSDPNFEPLQENLERLNQARDQDGAALEIVPLPMPRPLHFEGQRLPASYANFYVGNRVVLVPTFNDPADRQALELLARCFPDRETVGIHAVDLVWGLGTLHCLSREQPAIPSPSAPPAAQDQADRLRAL